MSIAKYEADPKGIGAKIRAAREQAGDSPEAVASTLHISGFQLGKIERGDYRSLPASVGNAIEALLDRYRIAAAASASSPPTRSDAVLHALNGVPVPIRTAVEALWQGQARLIAEFARAVWDAASAEARASPPAATSGDLGQPKMRTGEKTKRPPAGKGRAATG